MKTLSSDEIKFVSGAGLLVNKVESFDPSGAGTIFEGRSGRPVGPGSDNGKAKTINLGSGSGDVIRAGSGRGSPHNRG
ncbi:hypothetical protein LU604_16920 [Erwinia tracheiphila]|uniref:hypothetical protein n=1 Tax=Erwinia tracheiphila TaxID=65700 RepID=UPI001F330E1D|nr:hypothetical protein [Erwinia tracheiphila]UIA82257.1 hypothetical protein LU604_16920 [Erwinia tracheiphila]UIA90854.1 hypothetical protein LU632_16510 [Erwinia tracheiphila]